MINKKKDEPHKIIAKESIKCAGRGRQRVNIKAPRCKCRYNQYCGVCVEDRLYLLESNNICAKFKIFSTPMRPAFTKVENADHIFSELTRN